MDRAMVMSTKRLVSKEGADDVALDWVTLGQLVRRCTLDALAMHFAETGIREVSSAARPRGLMPAAQERVYVSHE
jgi:hypothetical protein